MEPKIKAVGYCRVSTDTQAKHGASLGVQLEEITNHCAYKNWELVETYEDAGISGHTAAKRPAFMAMVADAKAGKFNAVVVTYLSRFARNITELLQYVQTLDKYGVAFVAIRENIDGSAGATGKLMLHIMASLAEFERELTMERSAAGKAAKLKAGTMFNGKAPFGYQWVKEEARFVQVESEAAVYKQAVGLYLHGGLNMKQVAHQLNEGGNTGRHGKRFTSSFLSYMLKNPAYYGTLYANKHVYKNGTRTKELKPREQWVKYTLPALADKAVWDQIQARSTFNKQATKRLYNRETYWLRDLLTCEECGGKVQPHHGAKRKDGSWPRYYSCFWAMQSKLKLELEGRACKCGLPMVRAGQLEAAVWGKVVNRLALGGNRRKHLSRLLDNKALDKAVTAATGKLARHQKALAKKAKARDNLYSMLEAADLDAATKDEFMARLHANAEQVATLQAKVDAATVELNQANAAMGDATRYANFLVDNEGVLSQLAQALATLEPANRRRVVMAFLNGGTVAVAGRRGHKNNDSTWGINPHSLGKGVPNSVFSVLEELGLLSVFGSTGGGGKGPLHQNGADYFGLIRLAN